MSMFVAELKGDYSPEPEENVFQEIWKEYEKVILHSLVTSFGLDFLVHDQHGGDVDTIHNVREMDKDSKLKYKNEENRVAYENRTKYDTKEYHSDPRYTNVVRAARKDFDENGTVIPDTYVEGNEVIPRNANGISRGKQGQLDHVISAKDIHEDRGRILAGIDGKELANCEENLRYTNAALNRNMSSMSVEEYIQWCRNNPDKVNYCGKKGEPLPDHVEKKLRAEYARAKKAYDSKLSKVYYTSPKFAKDMSLAAGKRGAEMGVRQVMGFIFLEIWFAGKEELQAMPPQRKLEDMLEAVGKGVEKGLQNARLKYKELIAKFEEGFVAGALSSFTTTLCNMFFTTAKNLVRNIRQIYASVVQAGKVLLFNPDNLMLGDRIKTTTIILATGASVLVGSTVGELIGATPIGKAPVIGQIVTVFCSTLVSGLLSCTLLVFLDRSKFMNKLIYELNRIPLEVNNYKQIADAFEELAAEIADIDIAKFKADTEKYSDIARKISDCNDQTELNAILLAAYQRLDIRIPWQGDFDTFMRNRNNRLVFE